MKMKRNIFSVLIAAVLAIFFAGCSNMVEELKVQEELKFLTPGSYTISGTDYTIMKTLVTKNGESAGTVDSNGLVTINVDSSTTYEITVVKDGTLTLVKNDSSSVVTYVGKFTFKTKTETTLKNTADASDTIVFVMNAEIGALPDGTYEIDGTNYTISDKTVAKESDGSSAGSVGSDGIVTVNKSESEGLTITVFGDYSVEALKTTTADGETTKKFYKGAFESSIATLKKDGTDDSDTLVIKKIASAGNSGSEGTGGNEGTTEGNNGTGEDFTNWSGALTLEAITDNGAKVTFKNRATGPVTYKINGGTAQTIAANTDGEISLNKGDKVEFFGDNKTYIDANDEYNHSRISSDDGCYVYGNVMSLVDSENFATATVLEGDAAFACLFESGMTLQNHPTKDIILPATTLTKKCYQTMFSFTNLTRAPKLPATNLAESCYENMFSQCSELAEAPELPATTLASSCYRNMFGDCFSLTEAPELPATELAEFCYLSMFDSCRKLTKAPDLPATILASFCYKGMFKGCSILNYVKCLATDISAENCLTDWLSGVSATGTFVKDASMTGFPSGAFGIPEGWTVEDATD